MDGVRVGSPEWVHRERMAMGHLAVEKLEDFYYISLEDLDWLNEYMHALLSGQRQHHDLKALDVLKTPAPLQSQGRILVSPVKASAVKQMALARIGSPSMEVALRDEEKIDGAVQTGTKADGAEVVRKSKARTPSSRGSSPFIEQGAPSPSKTTVSSPPSSDEPDIVETDIPFASLPPRAPLKKSFGKAILESKAQPEERPLEQEEQPRSTKPSPPSSPLATDTTGNNTLAKIDAHLEQGEQRLKDVFTNESMRIQKALTSLRHSKSIPENVIQQLLTEDETSVTAPNPSSPILTAMSTIQHDEEDWIPKRTPTNHTPQTPLQDVAKQGLEENDKKIQSIVVDNPIDLSKSHSPSPMNETQAVVSLVEIKPNHSTAPLEMAAEYMEVKKSLVAPSSEITIQTQTEALGEAEIERPIEIPVESLAKLVEKSPSESADAALVSDSQQHARPSLSQSQPQASQLPQSRASMLSKRIVSDAATSKPKTARVAIRVPTLSQRQKEIPAIRRPGAPLAGQADSTSTATATTTIQPQSTTSTTSHTSSTTATTKPQPQRNLPQVPVFHAATTATAASKARSQIKAPNAVGISSKRKVNAILCFTHVNFGLGPARARTSHSSTKRIRPPQTRSSAKVRKSACRKTNCRKSDRESTHNIKGM